MIVKRRVTYKLYPSASQTALLLEHLRLHQQLYNAALQQRIEAWSRQRKSLSYVEQAKDLTALRRECPEFSNVNCHSLQQTLRRLDRAFKAFFSRLKKSGGKGAGFPRFKALDRYPGWSYDTHGDGFKFRTGTDMKHGKLYLQNIGVVKARGCARTPGRILCADVQRTGDGWFLSLVIECDSVRLAGTKAAGFDWGVSTFLSIAEGEEPGGASSTIENPRILQEKSKALKKAQRALSRCKRGSKRRLKAKTRVSRIQRAVRNARAEFHHQTSKRLVDRFSWFATEELQIRNMTRSAAGTVDEPGRNVAQKSGLNRNILDTAPAGFIAKLQYKAEEAGAEFVLYPARQAKASQTCPACGNVVKKALSQRIHLCEACGCMEDRDVAAARVLLRMSLGLMPVKASGSNRQELADAADTSVIGRRAAKPRLESPARVA